MKNNLSVAILTYGERKHLLYPVINAVLQQNVKNIYVYCNGISIALLNEYREKYKATNIDIIDSRVNLGSAGGYNELIKYVTKHNAHNFLLLLDDDNLVPSDLVKQLENKTISDNDILFINRKDRGILIQAKETNQPCLELGTINSFLGRDIFKSVCSSYEKIEGDLIAAPYSGLILPPSVLSKNLLPNKAYFLYADDHEYTYRLVTKHQYKITLVNSLTIKDLESSFHLVPKRFSFLSNRYLNAERLRLYHSVRNQFYFGRKRSQNKILFYLNVIFISSFILLGFIVKGDLKRVKYFLSSLIDGFKMKDSY